jgi:hypothetical protein
MQEWSALLRAREGDGANPWAPGELFDRAPLKELPGLMFGPIGGQVSATLLNLYRGDAERAHSLANDFAKSSMLRQSTATLHGRQLRATSALAMLERKLGDRATLLREVEQDARALARESFGKGFATAFRAAISLQRGARADALTGLDAAVREFDASHMKSYAAAIRDRAARLRDDASSASEITKAADVLRAEGVVSPERMIAMLLPGFGV